MTNVVDGLMENDKYGNIVPSLAEDWTVSKDGLTYTYKLRDGIKWYTSEGEEYADVTAQDFVTGLKHAADKEAGALFMVKDSVVGLADYVDGKEKDFSKVGVKALDDKTVQYTLNKPESFWNSKTTHGVLLPVNAEFLESKGDDYAKTTDISNVLSNGPFLLSAYTSKSSVEFTKNENYWDADNVKVDKVKLAFYDGSRQEALIEGFSNGSYTEARLFPNSSSYSEVKKKYDENIYFTPQGAGTYYGKFNLDRQAYNYTAKKSDKEKADSKAAIQNKDFRQAITFAVDKKSYYAQANGEDAAELGIRHTMVPTDFVNIGESSFGDEVEKYVVQYGDEWKDVDLSDGQNGLYNPDKAKVEFAKAKETLTTEGVSFPIHIDIPVNQTAESNVKMAQSFKKSVEGTLGTDNVVIDLHMMDEDAVHKITYYAEDVTQVDYDLSLTTGWLPDYEDPSTYLDIYDTSNTSSQTYVIGITGGSNSEVASKLGFDDYVSLLKVASDETQDVAKRYDAYAKAQAWLTDSAVSIPTHSNGATPIVTKVVPFTSAYGTAGYKNKVANYLKGLEVSDKPVTAKEYQEARKTWLEEKEKSNLKAQEDLANHVK